MSELRFTVPLVPPGCNHYVKHTRNGRHYVTSEAKSFKQIIAYQMPHWVSGKAFEVEAVIYLGSGQKGDVDGFAKLLLDGLAEAGAFRNAMGVPLSDAHVKRIIMTKERDPKNPRTEIIVRAING